MWPGGIEASLNRAVWHGGGLLQFRATGAQTHGAYALTEELLPAGCAPPRHIHHREDEALLVLDGWVTVWVGEQVVVADNGRHVFMPRGIAHTFRVDSPTARMLNIVNPAGFEHFFAEAGTPALELTLPPTEPADLERLVAIAADYGCDIIGPPPGPDA